MPSGEQGVFYYHSMLPILQFSADQTQAAIRHLYNWDPSRIDTTNLSPDNVITREMVNTKAYLSCSLQELEPAIVQVHELEHLRCFSSTPFGLAMWRIAHSFKLAAWVVMNEKNRAWSVLAPQCPLVDWFRDFFRDAEWPTNVSREERRNISEYGRFMAWMDMLAAFETSMLDSKRLANVQFLDLANRVSAVLSDELPNTKHTRWVSTRSPTAHYLEGTTFTTRQILEASARLKEICLLKMAGYQLEERANWMAKYSYETYSKCVFFLLDQLHDVKHARILLDEALCGDVDVLSGINEKRLEDVHPAWRFQRLVAIFRRYVKPKQELTQTHLRSLLEKEGLPCSHMTLSSYIRCPIPLTELDRNQTVDSITQRALGDKKYVTFNTVKIYNNVLSDFERAFHYRIADSELKLPEMSPSFLVYKDGFYPCALKAKQWSDEDVLLNLFEVIYNLVIRTLMLSNGDTSTLKAVQDSAQGFIARYALQGASRGRMNDDCFATMVSMSKLNILFSNLLPPTIAELLEW
jgi:hypothetical protein